MMSRVSVRLPTEGGVRRWLVASVALAVLGAAPACVRAGTVQFASFQSTGNSPFTFSNTTTPGNNATSATFSATTEVTFNFAAGLGLDPTDRAATLTLFGTTSQPVNTGFGFASQPINGPASLTIVENATGNLLLSMTFTGQLAGQLGGPNANLTGSYDIGDTVVFASHDLSFGASSPTGWAGNSYSLGLPTVSPLLATNGNFLNGFNSNINGYFVASVPQPTSLVMFGTGLAAPALLASRARRRRLARR
jgi:hypothetical protein